jgi:hypothetical protein
MGIDRAKSGRVLHLHPKYAMLYRLRPQLGNVVHDLESYPLVFPNKEFIMSTISKPGANPIAAALLTWLVLGIGHVVINGQSKKWVITLIATFIGSLLCVLPGIIIGILSVIDSYQTAVRLQKGEAIPENEYSNSMLYKVCKIMDKSATCSVA